MDEHPPPRPIAYPVPAHLVDAAALAANASRAERGGAAWRLEEPERDLDSNIIVLPPGDSIAEHDGPDLDVLIHVLSGSGTLTGRHGELRLSPGALMWLPRRSRRGFRAGPDGLAYLTVHQRKTRLTPSVP